MERKQQSPTKIAAMPVSVRYEQHFFLVSFSVPSLVLSKTPAQLCPWSPRLPTVTGFLFCNPGEPLVSMEFVTHSRWLDDLFFYRPVVTEGENYLTKAVSELCTSYMILLGRAWEHVGGCVVLLYGKEDVTHLWNCHSVGVFWIYEKMWWRSKLCKDYRGRKSKRVNHF